MPPECTTKGCTRAAVAEAAREDETWVEWKPYCDPCQQDMFTAGYTVRKYVARAAA